MKNQDDSEPKRKSHFSIDRFLLWLIIVGLAVVLEVVAWKVPGFADAYVSRIFPFWVSTYGRLTGLLNFSLGEILLYVAAGYTALILLTMLVRFILWINKKGALKGFLRVNLKVWLWIAAVIGLIQVLNCFILYHTTPLYEGSDYELYDPNTTDLFDLREKLVAEANTLSEEFERDEKGGIIYEGDMAETAKTAMEDLGEAATKRVITGKNDPIDERLSLLTGFYPTPKTFWLSDFFSQQSMKGYYFPFTMEANYNSLMYISNVPDTMCHELSHLKGFIFEDEATFVAYLACINSDDSFFVYSGVLNALAYVNNECAAELEARPELENLLTISPRNDLVKADMVFLTEDAWAEVEKDAVLNTDFVSDASEDFLNTNLTLNGVEDGVLSYSRVVQLLLKYYYGGED